MSKFRSFTLYVIRHGECEHNVEDWVASHDDSPLTAKGRAQAREKGRLLKELASPLGGLAFYSSPLHRACVTMELMREEAGLPHIGYAADHRLMEMHTGDHIRRKWSEIPEHHHTAFRSDPWNAFRPGGESAAMVHARIERFLRTLNHDCVIVTHGMTSRMIRGHFLGLTPEQVLEYELPNSGLLRLASGAETYFKGHA
jgi:probable phosphoglycerate mutase